MKLYYYVPERAKEAVTFSGQRWLRTLVPDLWIPEGSTPGEPSGITGDQLLKREYLITFYDEDGREL